MDGSDLTMIQVDLRGPRITNSKSLELYNISSLISLVYSKLNTTIFQYGHQPNFWDMCTSKFDPITIEKIRKKQFSGYF